MGEGGDRRRPGPARLRTETLPKRGPEGSARSLGRPQPGDWSAPRGAQAYLRSLGRREVQSLVVIALVLRSRNPCSASRRFL
jgi:hypothetical protein